MTWHVQADDPWAIMPGRTLRGAGARPPAPRADEDLPAETLQERVVRENRDETSPGPLAEGAEALHDLLILPGNPAFRASEQGVKALLLYLDRSQLLRGPNVSALEEFVGHPSQTRVEDWRERLKGGQPAGQMITLKPGEFCHQLFFEGEAPKGAPSLQRALIAQRPRPAPVPFGPEGREASFWLALIGCRFPEVSRGFLARLHSILYLRPTCHRSPHRP